MKTRRQLILDTIEDMISDLLYYDRKEDEDLGVNDIFMAIHAGEISVEEIVNKFKNDLEEGLK